MTLSPLCQSLRRIEQGLPDRAGVVADLCARQRQDAPAGVDQAVCTRIIGGGVEQNGKAEFGAGEVCISTASNRAFRKAMRLKAVVAEHVRQHAAGEYVFVSHISNLVRKAR